ncbi:MAG: DUF805 domain-containing protein [Microbacteriaceae bacterium]|nr:DUF805 domain-containing protein [Microbacteriaceae bacterium]
MEDNAQLTFVDAVRLGFREWRNIDGRASRRAFWFWFLFTVLASAVVSTIDSVLSPASTLEIPEDVSTLTGDQIRMILDTTMNESLWTFSTLVMIWLFVPTLTVTIRRFRDVGSPVWLAWAVHLIGPISLAVLLWLGYESADLIDAGVSEVNAGDLLTLALSMLVITLANVAAFIVWVVVAARPARTTELR